jgi:hypothetical protein
MSLGVHDSVATDYTDLTVEKTLMFRSLSFLKRQTYGVHGFDYTTDIDHSVYSYSLIPGNSND